MVSKMKHLITYAFSILLLAGVTAPDGLGRSMSGNQFPSGVAGRVTDRNGAVIAGARIRVTARSSKRVFSFETDSKGEYVADLDPGVYDVEAEAAGFKKERRASIPVMREARSYIDFVMVVNEETTDPQHP
jgi:hypothetical protein